MYSGADGQYVLYDDDGISQEYLRGRGTWTRFVWDDRARRLTIEPGAPAGATNVVGPAREFRVVVMPEAREERVRYEGRRVGVTVR